MSVHKFTENIIHLVLAKIPGPDGRLVPGTRGISLFVVPKRMVDAEGRFTGERNDVTLAGLNHKCGWRGTTNTLLSFGEGRHRPHAGAGAGLDGQGSGAVGYLVGRPGEGLRCMVHLMNEACLGLGMACPLITSDAAGEMTRVGPGCRLTDVNNKRDDVRRYEHHH